MEIIDTIYLIAYFRPSDPLHENAIAYLENLGDDRVVSQASLIEFDLLMKTRGLESEERRKTWLILHKLIDASTIEPVTPLDMAIATYLVTTYNLDYFDSLISAQCIVRKAKPLTTDKEILDVVSKRGQILSALRRQMSYFTSLE